MIKLPDYIEVEDMTILEGLFKSLLQYGQSTEVTSKLRTNLIMQEIICYYIENAHLDESNITKSVTVERIKLIMDYIHAHIKDNLTIEGLAQVVHLHPNYFIRLFKSNFGSSPMKYINNMRIEEAKMLILLGNISFEAVATQVGIKDYYYFSKLFKEETGYSPRAFKKLNSDTLQL